MSKIDFTSDAVHENLLRFSVPSVILATMDYLAIFINLGWLTALASEEGLPATFRVSSLVIGVLEAVFSGVLGAVYIYANQAYGRRDMATVRHLVNFGLGLSLLIGIAVFASGALVSQSLLGLFGIDDAIRQQAERYLSVYWYGYIAVIVYLYGGLIAKMSGDIRLVIRVRVATFVCNLLVTPLLIILAMRTGHDPIQATACALIASRLFGIAVLGIALHARGTFSFRIRPQFLPERSFSDWAKVRALAGAETVNGLSLTLSFFLVFLCVSYYDPETITAVTIAQYVTAFFHTILIGGVGALIPFVAQNAGTHNLLNIRRGVSWMTGRVLLICVGVAMLYMLVAPWFVHLFVDDELVAAAAIEYIRITSIPWALLVASFPYLFAVIGLGDTRGTLLLTLWSMYLCNLMPLIAVRLWIGSTPMHAAIAEAAAHILTFAGCVLYFRYRLARVESDWRRSTPAVEPAVVPT